MQMPQMTLTLAAGITNIDFLFSLAELVNASIHRYFEDEMRDCFGYQAFGQNASVHVVPGPVKRPSRALAYQHPLSIFAHLFNTFTLVQESV